MRIWLVAIAALLLTGCGLAGGQSPRGTPTLTPPTTPTPSATRTAEPATPPPSPDMARLIAQEKTRQQASGFTVKAEVTGSFDSVNEHWVAIYRPTATPAEYTERLVIYERRGLGLVPLLTEQAHDFYPYVMEGSAFRAGGTEDQPVLTDINGDGLKELPLGYSRTGGNAWQDHWLRIYTVRQGAPVEVPVILPITGLPGIDTDGNGTAAVASGLVDLDGDGVYEVLASDASWELHEPFGHADSPGGSFVLAWDGLRYTNASTRFLAYYNRRIAEDEASLSNCDWHRRDGGESAVDDCLMGAAISMVLDYGHSGRGQAGWTRYREVVRNVNSQRWRDALPGLESDLERSVPPELGANTTPIPTPTPFPGINVLPSYPAPVVAYSQMSRAPFVLMPSQSLTPQTRWQWDLVLKAAAVWEQATDTKLFYPDDGTSWTEAQYSPPPSYPIVAVYFGEGEPCIPGGGSPPRGYEPGALGGLCIAQSWCPLMDTIRSLGFVLGLAEAPLTRQGIMGGLAKSTCPDVDAIGKEISLEEIETVRLLHGPEP
jgi:hypothetical protein